MLMHSICFILCHLSGLFSVDGGKERRREKTSNLARFLRTHGYLLAKYGWKSSCPFGAEHREPQGKNRFPQTKSAEKRVHCSCCRFVINKQFYHHCFEILVSPTSSPNRLNPLTPKISLVILLTVCHTVLVMLVWRICIGSIYNPLHDMFLYSHPSSAWYRIDVVRRNSVLVTHGS